MASCTTADAVGNNDATLQGGTVFASGKNWQGVALNGSGQFVDTSAQLLDTSGNYTATAWVKLIKADGSFETRRRPGQRVLPAVLRVRTGGSR